MSFISEVIFPHKAGKGIQNKSAYDFAFTNIKNGEEIKLSNYKNRLIIIINTASKCRFTEQYNDMQKIYAAYHRKGLTIIAVPSNSFGKQEPSTNKNIKKFCRTNYGIDFPVTTKTVITGENAHDFYQWAEQYMGYIATPKWNFHKYIISPDGKLIDFLLPFTKITSKKAINIIENNLPSIT